MAPPPEYDKEPKAPDKSATNISCDETKTLHNLANDQQTNSDSKPSSTAGSTDVENNKLVETLDDGQLRALLDEAITYKCPKDREGKSSLFKELLEEVELDEQASEAAARTITVNRSVNRASGRGSRSRRALPHSNSLQDLVAALAAEPAPRRHHRAPPAPAPAPVSARAIHGGSLPSGVDTSFLLGEEPARGAGYLATVRCVNPPPLAERRVSTDASCNELDSLNRRSKPAFPMTYTARATLEIGSGAVSSGRAVTTTTASNQVDSAIPFSCITTPEVVASCNTTSSTQSAVAVDPKPLQLASSYRAVTSLVGSPPPCAASPPPAPAPAPATALSPQRAAHLLAPLAGRADQPRGVITSSFNGLPLSRPNYGSTGNTSQDEYKKSIDENGNSVQGFSSPLSGSSQHKKPRRKKSSKNETVIKSHQIDGYQGNKDLNEVLRFIESAADNQRAGKLGRSKHREDGDDKGGKKRKNKESKIKRATSMEELSLSRMEDLTDKPSPPARAPRHSDQAKAERRSWGDDARDATTRFFREEPIDVPVVPDTEFQTVTKKRKPRRHQHEQNESHEQHEPAGGDPPRANRPPEPRARRVSAPPSDRSNDSNDDMDSVHSLPADAVVTRSTVPAPISYADIARTRHNIPDLIESCNYYSEPERDRSERDRVVPISEAPLAPLPSLPGLTDGYPALEPRGRRSQPAAKPQQTSVPNRNSRKVDRTESVRNSETTVPTHTVEEWPAPDVVADRRPAVILLDTAAQARDMDGITFGFDINETLLGDPPRRARCDLLRDALEGTTPPDSNGALASGGGVEGVAALAGGGAVGVAVGGACGALRYVPPAPPADTLHLHQIIDYVGAAWEDVLRLGKVRYYSE